MDNRIACKGLPLEIPRCPYRTLTTSHSRTSSTEQPCSFRRFCCICRLLCKLSRLTGFLVAFRRLYSSCQRVYPLAIPAQNPPLPLPKLLPILPTVIVTLTTLTTFLTIWSVKLQNLQHFTHIRQLAPSHSPTNQFMQLRFLQLLPFPNHNQLSTFNFKHLSITVHPSKIAG